MKPKEQSALQFVKYAKSNSDNRFMSTLRTRIDEHFKTTHTSKYANLEIVFKALLIFATFGVSYYLLISGKYSGLTDLFLGTVCGLCTVFIVMNIGHDAVHHALSPNKKLNNLLAYTFEIAGLSHLMWKINHNIIHHPFPNVSPIDSEINQAMPFLRLSPYFKKLAHHKYQHFYAPFIYLFFTINLTLIRDFQDAGIFPKENSQKAIRKFSINQYIFLITSKIFYIGYTILLPMYFLDFHWWQIILGFMFVHAVMSIYELIIQFPLHANDHATVTEVDENRIIQRQMDEQIFDNTTDYMPQNKFMNFITGGINTHTIHHFFPGICHVHYKDLTPILEKTAKEFNMPYHLSTWSGGMASHFRRIKQLAELP